jgi:hypothetical protein
MVNFLWKSPSVKLQRLTQISEKLNHRFAAAPAAVVAGCVLTRTEEKPA